MPNNKIIVVAGPTASGKTKLAIELAKALNGEIISADSMQVYKNMSIASAAPTDEERAEARHHLVEILDPNENFSVAEWCRLAKKAADDIISRGRIPIIAGGTGLFIDSFVDNIVFEDVGADIKLRNELMSRSADSLYDELKKADPESAENIHKNNKKRVARALELYYSGVSKTKQNENSRKIASPYDTLYFVISFDNRQVLYDRINARVDAMIAKGLVNEAKANMANYGTGAQAIGHKELAPFIRGEISLETAVAKLKQKTRNYAKRQITWFKRRNNAVVLKPDIDGFDNCVKKAVAYSEEFINGSENKEKSE